jgi:hypothetical protein
MGFMMVSFGLEARSVNSHRDRAGGASAIGRLTDAQAGAAGVS